MPVSLHMTDAEARAAARAALRSRDVVPEIESDACVVRLDEDGAEYIAVEAWVYMPVEPGESDGPRGEHC